MTVGGADGSMGREAMTGAAVLDEAMRRLHEFDRRRYWPRASPVGRYILLDLNLLHAAPIKPFRLASAAGLGL